MKPGCISVTLVTAVLAALATLAASENGTSNDISLFFISIFSLFALSIVGWVTLHRIIKRNEATDGYKKDMDEIRQRFKDYFDERGVLLEYLPFRGQREKSKLGLKKDPPKKKISICKFGGLAHTVAATNSLILSELIDTELYVLENMLLVIMGTITAFALVFCLQYRYIQSAEKRHESDLHRSDLTHAGGIVGRRVHRDPQCLVVPAKKQPKPLGLPKRPHRARRRSRRSSSP
ncbi:MAG: hypothetical protein SWQ30_02550 [Thermodesulfobacteriota bacterium]|nr:hypothetical protein [Thermodesulfobacteriota bacterium]